MKSYIDKILESSLVILLGIMVINVVWQVIARTFNISSSWTEELARYLLIWLGMLSAAYATGKKLHLAIDLLPQSLEGASAKRLQAVITILMALFALGVMVIGGSRLVILVWELGQTSAAMKLPMGWVYGIIPISGVLIVYYCMHHLITPDPLFSPNAQTK
ncbi:TRAP transporter small permease [Pontibacter sp. G13]|uniref:TRAP transporter small permease n=1 Tax=Pontibacter sp. G13 TaxID=3074898 RepID=UPI00288A5423|nr:TRAP transporter small permease [Pontibacter sp. G13]WNJ20993.1 TRAP transporter small permease [Pontibacter sp. G13]